MIKKNQLLLCSIFPVFLFSCEKEPNETITVNESIIAETETTTISFKGLIVNHRFSATEEDLTEELTETTLNSFYNSERQAKSEDDTESTTFLEADLPEFNVIYQAASNVISEFPFDISSSIDNSYFHTLLKEKNQLLGDTLVDNTSRIQELDRLIDEELIKKELEQQEIQLAKMEMIKEDFSNLTDEEIESNIEVINEYYRLNFDFETAKEIVNNESDNLSSVSQKALTSAASDYDFTDQEQCVYDAMVAEGYGTLGTYAFGKASEYVMEVDEEVFPDEDPNNTYRDAYRHMLWSSLLCYYYGQTLSSKVDTVNFSEFIGNQNEICRDEPGPGTEMDYHNNNVGRNVWSDNTSYNTVLWITYGLTHPSIATQESKIYAKVVTGCFIPTFHLDKFPWYYIHPIETRDDPIDDWWIEYYIDEVDEDSAVFFQGGYRYYTSEGPESICFMSNNTTYIYE